MEKVVITWQEAVEFYNQPDFYKACMIDGATKDQLLKSMVDHMHHIASKDEDGTIAAVTAYKPLGEGLVEVHTFVLPKYRKRSKELLRCHIWHLLYCGYKELVTFSTNQHESVKNFLIKRLNFKLVDSWYANGTIKGEPFQVYELRKNTYDIIEEEEDDWVYEKIYKEKPIE